jgi:DinB family protein
VHPQLQAITDEYESAGVRLRRLLETVPAERWAERPAPERWSIAECVGHLNLTTEGFRPLVEAALAEGRRRGGPAPEHYRRDFVGWLMWRTAGPPARVRVKTTARFVSQSTAPARGLVTEFERLQAEQLRWVAAADGLPLGSLQITSPFNARLKYNLYSLLTILPRHEHRHLWQAEQAWQALQQRS